jgi:hypothetical protein
MDGDGLYKVLTVEDRGVDVVEVVPYEVEIAGTEVTLTKGEVKNREIV